MKTTITRTTDRPVGPHGLKTGYCHISLNLYYGLFCLQFGPMWFSLWQLLWSFRLPATFLGLAFVCLLSVSGRWFGLRFG